MRYHLKRTAEQGGFHELETTRRQWRMPGRGLECDVAAIGRIEVLVDADLPVTESSPQGCQGNWCRDLLGKRVQRHAPGTFRRFGVGLEVQCRHIDHRAT